MPDWQPNWTDVAFDHGAADDASARCRAAAAAIAVGLDAEHAARGTVTADWRGALRGRFEDAVGATSRDLDGLRDQLLALADAIDTGADRAHAEQARREAARERWRQEADRERLLRRLGAT